MENFKGIVYLLKTESQPVYKIGYTTDLPARMASIKTGSPFFKIHKAYVADRKNEQHLHEKFDSQRVSGEWFVLMPDDLEFIDAYFFDLYTRAGIRFAINRFQEYLISCTSKRVGIVSVKTMAKTKVRKTLKYKPVEAALNKEETILLKKKGFSIDTCAYLKSILIETPYMTAAELALESGYSLTTAKHFKAIFNKSNTCQE